MKAALLKLVALAVAVPSLAWGNSCAREDSDGRIINGCRQTVVFSFCGIGSSSVLLDCRRGQLGMAGVPPGWTIIDARGYDRVFTMNCPDGSPPSNTEWNGRGLTGKCR